MDSLILQLSREGALFPQSPDEDLASRLILRSLAHFRAARRAAIGHADSALLLAYVALHGMGRALLAAKGYRPSSKDPHGTVRRTTAHFLGENAAKPLKAYDALLDAWKVSLEDADMPPPAGAAGPLLQQTEALLKGLRKVFEKESPSFRALFQPRKPRQRTISAERSFRD